MAGAGTDLRDRVGKGRVRRRGAGVDRGTEDLAGAERGVDEVVETEC